MILFFYGEETFVPSQKIQQLKKKFLAKNPTGGGLLVFDCDEECDVYDIVQAFGEQNLFAQKKLIIIEDIITNTKAPEQKGLIDSIKSNEDVIVFFEKNNPRKNSILFKWLIKNADKLQENKLLEGQNLEKWIVAELQKSDKKIDRDALAELILFVGNDLWKLHSEIGKLIAYVDDDRNITIEDVHLLVHGKVDANMFGTVEAIASKDKSIALTLLNKQLATGDEPFHVFSMYAYQIRVLLRVGSMIEDGVRDKTIIAKELKLHPFVVQKTIGMIDDLSYKKIRYMHKILTKLDYDIKMGNRDITSALTHFVMI